mgnify:CR=1 FL=1
MLFRSELIEYGNTAAGRKRLEKFIADRLSKDPKLDSDVKRAYAAKTAAGQVASKARKEHAKGKATESHVRKAEERADKRHKIYWGRIDKVRKSETDVARAAQRIASKGKNIKKPLASKTMVDKDGVRKTETRRPGLEESLVNERHMTSGEMKKETTLKKKYDPSAMKEKMIKQYGAEKGKQVYFATIRKKAMDESLAFPMLEGGKKGKKKTWKESGPDTPIQYPSGNVGKDRDTGYAI